MNGPKHIFFKKILNHSIMRADTFFPAGMSIPENFTIYHGDNLFTNGPEGVQRNLASRVMCKKLLGPRDMSFQQVQRWIYEMFNVDEAAHELVLRHIVPVKPKNQTRPYNIVVDIVSLESWRTFLDVSLRLAVPLVLYVHWQAKAAPGPVYQGVIGDKNSATSARAPAPAPALVPAPAPAAASKEPTVAGKQGGSWPSCRKHGKPCSIETSWDSEDPGRRFYRCPLFEVPYTSSFPMSLFEEIYGLEK